MRRAAPVVVGVMLGYVRSSHIKFIPPHPLQRHEKYTYIHTHYIYIIYIYTYLRLDILIPHGPQGLDIVPYGVPALGGPGVDGDEDALPLERLPLPGLDADLYICVYVYDIIYV